MIEKSKTTTIHWERGDSLRTGNGLVGIECRHLKAIENRIHIFLREKSIDYRIATNGRNWRH